MAPKILTCLHCGSAYDEVVVAEMAVLKPADKLTSDGVHGDKTKPVQKSVNCRVCGNLLYRTVNGERVAASRDEALLALAPADLAKELTPKERDEWAACAGKTTEAFMESLK